MLSNSPAAQPPKVYSSRPAVTSVFAPNSFASELKNRLVRTINSAGILIIICTKSWSLSAKYFFITPRAGATAAPAITVSRDSDNMLTVSDF